jgi:hypothetical protein
MFTKVHSYAIGGDLVKLKQEVEKQLQSGNKAIADIIDVPASNSGDTPLLMSVAAAHVDIVRYLIEQGANILVRDANRNTVLHAALLRIIGTRLKDNEESKKLYEIVEILLRANINLLNIPGFLGKTPWSIASSKHPICLKLEIKSKLLKIIEEINPKHPLIENERKVVKQEGVILLSKKEVESVTSPLLSPLRYRHPSKVKQAGKEEARTAGRLSPDPENPFFCSVQ